MNNIEPTRSKEIMRIIVSLILLIAGILTIWSPEWLFSTPASDDVQKIAAGWVGAVIGYWLS